MQIPWKQTKWSALLELGIIVGMNWLFQNRQESSLAGAWSLEPHCGEKRLKVLQLWRTSTGLWGGSESRKYRTAFGEGERPQLHLSLAISYKSKHSITTQPGNSNPGYLPKWAEIFRLDKWMWMLKVDLFPTAGTRKQPRCPSVDKRVPSKA